MRTVPMDMQHQSLDMERVMDYVDEYTIGIVGIMGYYVYRAYDDIKKSWMLWWKNTIRHTDYKVYIHVRCRFGRAVYSLY